MRLLLIILLTYMQWREVGTAVVQEDKTFKLNGIFPITAPDHVNYQSGVMMAEAMKYAVDKINKQKTYLHSYVLKIVQIFDSVDDSEVKTHILHTFMRDVPFLVGPYSSETSYISSILTETFKQIAVSYGATYSDFNSAQRYMRRTVPSDRFRVQAALKVVKNLDWNYVGIISSYGFNGERESLHFISQLSHINICVATQVDLLRQETEEGYTNAMKTMKNEKRLKALVFFTTLKDSRSLLLAIEKLNLEGRFYILCMYGCTNYIEVTKGVENIANGILSIDISSPEVPGFREYFLSLKPTNKSEAYFKRFWEDLFGCSLNDATTNNTTIQRCNGTEKLSEGKGYYPLTPVASVIDAVQGLADAIRNAVGEDMLRCDTDTNDNNIEDIATNSTNSTNSIGKKCILSTSLHADTINSNIRMSLSTYKDGTIKHTSRRDKTLIKYDIHRYMNGKNKQVGHWKTHRKEESNNQSIKETYQSEIETAEFELDEVWTLSTNGSHLKVDAKMHAYCSSACPAGHIKIRDNNIKKRKCCWECRKCPPHNIAFNDTCVACKVTEMPDHTSATCSPLPRKYINLDRFESWLISVLSILGLAAVCFVTIVFIRFNDNRIVRASGRDLCYLILLGICLTFLCPFVFLVRPSTKTCLFRGGMPGLAFICCYAPLFLRTNRIYRIFFHAKISIARPALVSSQSQVIVSCGIVAIQMLLVVVWFVSRMPSPQETVDTNNLFVNLHCKADSSPILLVLNLALSVIFMISCTILAFKTRHFPKNYNEAKYIGITLYLSCVAWAVFFPAYFLTNPKTEFLKEYLMCAICIAIGFITLLGLFGQKVRMLLWSVPKSSESDLQPTWYLSDSEASYKHHSQLSSHPTTDTLLCTQYTTATSM